MNRYLTILLVFITATGSEAQILTSALDVQCGNMRIEQMLSPEQLRTMGTDIMAVLKALNGDTDNTTAHTFYNHTLHSGIAQRIVGNARRTRDEILGTPANTPDAVHRHDGVYSCAKSAIAVSRGDHSVLRSQRHHSAFQTGGFQPSPFTHYYI